MRQFDTAGRVDMAKRVYNELELLTSDLGEFPEQETEDLMVEMESRAYARRERDRMTTAFAARRTTSGNGRGHGSGGSSTRPAQPGLPILDEDDQP